MSKIIGISGKKQSGKNTTANFITGQILLDQEMVFGFDLTDKGELLVETIGTDGNKGWGVFDVTRKDVDFVDYAEREMWPYTKLYHFADPLKMMAVELFDLHPSQVYGTDEDKNTDTAYGMTSREFLQYLGTDVMRKIKDTIWVDYTLKMIKKENSEVAIIPDVRFPNEVSAIHDAGGVVVRLTRDIAESSHQCEQALDPTGFSWDNFDYVVNNHDKNLDELKTNLIKIEHLWRK